MLFGVLNKTDWQDKRLYKISFGANLTFKIFMFDDYGMPCNNGLSLVWITLSLTASYSKC